MKLELKIMLAGIRRHPMRIIFTSLAMIASSCVVVWVVSGYDAMVSQFHESAQKSLGRYEMVVVPESWKLPELDPAILAELGRDPVVQEIDHVMQCKATITRGDGFAGDMMLGPPGGSPGGRTPGGPPGTGGRGGRGGPPGNGDSGKQNASPTSKGANPKRSQMDGFGGPPGGADGGGLGGGSRGEKSPDGVSVPGNRSSQEPEPYQPSGSAPAQPGAPSPMRMMMMFGSPILVGSGAKEPPNTMKSGMWINAGKSADMNAVVSSGVADRLKIDLGGELLVKSDAGEFRLKVAGIVAQAPMQADLNPGRMGAPGSVPRGPAAMAVYVPVKLAEKISGLPEKISIINIILKKDSDAIAFRDRWKKLLSDRQPKAEIYSVKDVESALEQNRMAASARMQAYSATGMSLMAALFIIFTTLSMGVNERIRQFAILRAVALTRGQIALMIAMESLVMGFIGWCGGLAAGWGLLKVISKAHPDLFQNGASLGSWCIWLTGASAFGGALAASIIPAWRATTISPMDAFSPPSTFHRFRLSLVAIVAGIILVIVNPLLVFVVPMPDGARYFMHAAIGCTCMGLGFLLLMPLTMMAVEKIFCPLISRLLLIDPRLLKSQLTGNMWRTLGTTVSLSIGLGLFIATVTWGYSMLQPFVPGDWVPDMLFSFQRGAILDFEVDNIRLIKGIRAKECIPLAVDQPTLANDITGSEQRNSVIKQDNVIMIGLDPQVAFGGASPVLRPKFVNGSSAEAIEKLKQGRYCIVPDHFLKATGLKIGDSFKMIPPEAPETQVEYTIAAAVALPGWHWMTKFSGLRRRSGRSAAMVFANFETVRKDFKLEKVNFVWMNLEKGAIIDDIGSEAQEIADRNLGEQQPVNAQGMWGMGAKMFGKSLRISTRDDVRDRIGTRADGMIWGMCQIPLITLLIASLAVINTVMASVRARRWEMGVLRSVGITRFGLVRLIIAESILIGIVACIISVSFGVMAGYCGTGISQYVSFFGGLDTPLVMPWAKIFFGIGVTLLICLMAALWPAIATGRQEILRLLAEGRGNM